MSLNFEYEDLAFEFVSKESATKGDLEVVRGDGEDVFSLEVDLAKKRSRTQFAMEANELYPETFSDLLELKRALNELHVQVKEMARIAAAQALEEDASDDRDPSVPPPKEGTERYEPAMEILEAEDVLERAALDMKRLGHIGEWSNKKLAFACAISARAQLPVQPSSHAQSSAGKNYLWDTALALVPPELVYKRTGFSAKALFRTNMSLKHSVLYIQELAGSEGADFSIRTLQSDNVLKWEATEKQPDGSIANVEYEVEGPTVIIQTTTRNHLHPENETRVVPLYLDESAEQTEKITEAAKTRAAGIDSITIAERDAICTTWHDAVRLLEPAEMVIPFAQHIEVPSAPLRIRRDVPRLFNVIKLIAWVHQHTRERDDAGRILATENDFDMAIGMVGDSFARAWKALTPTEEMVYAACKVLPDNLRKHGFKRAEVEASLKKRSEYVPHTSLKDALASLAGNGYLESEKRRGSVGNLYTLSRETGTASSISLAPAGRSAIDYKSPANDDKTMAESQSGHSRPSAINEDEEVNEEAHGRIAGNGRIEARPLKRADLQEKDANGRMADDDPRKKVNYEYEVITEKE